MSTAIASATNPKVKRLVKLRNRRDRDAERAFIIEGYRELSRAVAAGIDIGELYSCEELFLGVNEGSLIDDVVSTGVIHVRLEEAPFRKAAYRDRPEGLLAVASQFDTNLALLDLRSGSAGPGRRIDREARQSGHDDAHRRRRRSSCGRRRRCDNRPVQPQRRPRRDRVALHGSAGCRLNRRDIDLARQQRHQPHCHHTRHHNAPLGGRLPGARWRSWSDPNNTA